MKPFYIIIVFLVSCHSRFEQSELHGKYVFNSPDGDTLELKSDGTYLHYTTEHFKRMESAGKWELNSYGNEIKFEDFYSFTKDMPPGTSYSGIRTKGEEIHLMYDVYKNSYYKKIE